ncbi:MAG: hypothetical protein ACRDA3_09445 [Peptostreptococcaceae bacterium]
MFEYLYGYDEESNERDYYSFRTHTDTFTIQHCPYCGEEVDFTYDRCSNCHNQ